MTFTDFNFHPRILAGIQHAGYTSPTPIQQRAIPPILAGKDLIGLAQTGTGKTAAFVLPILQKLLHQAGGRGQALIIAPTRELSEQIHRTIVQMARRTNISSVSIYGGVGMQPQIRALSRGVDIVSACPGRLLDHINRGTIRLSGINMLVLDEADQMLDMGFLPDIRKIVRRLPQRRQTLLFSATMPENIRQLASEMLQDPIRVQTERTAPAATVAHTFYPVEAGAKNRLLKKILDEVEARSVLVFTRTKRRSKSLAQQLDKWGFSATALNGNLTQNKRQETLQGFHDGRYKILVATDIAARGIDVRGISHVVNYDIPATVDAYTHRIGRTGRARDTGDAFTFVSDEDTKPARAITKVLGAKLKYCVLKEFGGGPAPAPARRQFKVERRRI